MANHKSCKKRILVTAKKNAINTARRSSVKTAKEHNASLTKIILYTNSVFGFPKAGEDAIERQKKVEKAVVDQGMSFEWMFGDNILDVVSKTPLAYSLFFEIDSNLNHLPTSVERMNELNFGNISSTIKFQNTEIELDRAKEVADLKEFILNGRNILIPRIILKGWD